MTTDFYNLLLSDCALALILLALFWYVSRISPGLRGIASWGVAHLVYSLGASMLDGTSQELVRTGNLAASQWISGIGGLLACGGLAGLAWSIILFVRQRPLTRAELALMPLFLGFSLIGWLAWGTVDAQGAAMSAAEVIALALIVFHLARLDTAPDHLPARLMMAGCVVLGVLYGRDLWQAVAGDYGPNEDWVNIDLSTWYLLNFCMLMLTSFRAAESLRQSALFDPLTGALNRRGLNAELASRLRLPRAGHVAVLALDLDHFKSINDDHGHAAGDAVLQRFADAVRASIRGEDLFARVGGEEFVLVLRRLPADEVQHMAERIRARIDALALEDVGAGVRVTCSFGIAHGSAAVGMKALMQAADEALYEAKRLGRNRIQLREVDARGPVDAVAVPIDS
ncbi:MAG TPA: GGDEF domain-containing protein [Luteimonas sp.]|nr:GGDEF domain-containing protein [Luteimonas sp.]